MTPAIARHCPNAAPLTTMLGQCFREFRSGFDSSISTHVNLNTAVLFPVDLFQFLREVGVGGGGSGGGEGVLKFY